MAVSAFLSFAVVCGFGWMLPVTGDRLWYTNSIVPVFFFLALWTLAYRILKTSFEGKGAKWFFPLLFGLFFSICMVFGAQLNLTGWVPFTQGKMWIGILALTVFVTLTVRYFWDRLLEWKVKYPGPISSGASNLKRPKGQETGSKDRRSFFLTAGAILLMYLPVFLAVYPGFFVYDAQDEYLQEIGRAHV